ncbi:purine/pyrimidine permease [Kyrpidia tusciae]|uniref:Xanthine/uracil/vitamin C permease n=1 Tax=Kyrpidia tusciae (strain DSM 2912 / NBRC 15312 / T2) TaxID=562970 RepID=D5WT48_KYRT2|nr:purine/pyrimidine permease [Kyrpidia tusciae]ADG05152.1 Xanthine/uracil/vitamin C permease [Kyrpidia tusciae DSM 2912]
MVGGIGIAGAAGRSVQWLIYLIASVVPIPVVLAQAFHLDPVTAAGFISRACLVAGAASLVQGLWGHRMPINDGPAGLWFAVFFLFASAAAGGPGIPRALEMGLLAAGTFVILLAVTGAFQIIRKWFTSAVTGCYLLLLAAQMAGPFFEGVLGLPVSPHGVWFGWGGMLTVAIILAASLGPVRWLRQYSVLIGMAIGWMAMAAAGYHSGEAAQTGAWFAWPSPFLFGPPVWNWSVVVNGLFVSIILISNLVASVEAMERILQVPPADMRRAGFWHGVTTVAAGVAGTVGMIPQSTASGFVALTGIRDRLPFFWGSAMLAAMGFFPGIAGWLAAMPREVGYGVMFASFTQLILVGLDAMRQAHLGPGQRQGLGLALLLGLGLTALPSGAFSALPQVVRVFLSNGLVVGTLVYLLWDGTYRWVAGRRSKGCSREGTAR